MGANFDFYRVFQSDLSQLGAVRRFIADSVAALGGSADDAFACELAVDEAVTNICNHAYGDGKGPVAIGVARANGDVLIHIRNWGRPFDPESVPEPDTSSPLEDRKLGGLGVFFMRQVMAQVEFQFDAREGNLLIMRRALIKN